MRFMRCGLNIIHWPLHFLIHLTEQASVHQIHACIHKELMHVLWLSS